MFFGFLFGWNGEKFESGKNQKGNEKSEKEISREKQKNKKEKD